LANSEARKSADEQLETHFGEFGLLTKINPHKSGFELFLEKL